MRDEALASGKNRGTPTPNIPLRFEIMVTARLPAAILTTLSREGGVFADAASLPAGQADERAKGGKQLRLLVR